MRLIDADKIKFKWINGVICVEQKNIEKMPTVDAVPVEWIEIDIEQSAFSGYDMHSYEVASMLEEWKEKERKDDEQTTNESS